MERPTDPYRTLGVPRGATDAQIKAAHRRLAKRWHPDTAEGDTARFLEIQAAYSLLADPLRRREWDRAHSAEPVRANEPGARRTRAAGGRPRTARTGERPPPAQPTGPDEAGTTGGARPRASRRPGGGRGRTTANADAGAGPGMDPGDPRHGHAGTWSASDREPGMRTGTWSASGVPWWEDFQPRGDAGPAGGDPAGARTRARGSARGGTRPGGAAGTTGAAAPSDGGATSHAGDADARRSPDEMDLYSRSSGAAWSMAARRHFRKGDDELARGGAFRYRGTQVVTGGEARRVAAEEAAEEAAAAQAARSGAEEAARREREALLRRDPRTTAPRTAFDHESSPPGARAATDGGTATTGRATSSRGADTTGRTGATGAPDRAATAATPDRPATPSRPATPEHAPAGPAVTPGVTTPAVAVERPTLIGRLRSALRIG